MEFEQEKVFLNEHEQEIVGLGSPIDLNGHVIELFRRAQQQNDGLQEQLRSPLRGDSGAARSELPRSIKRVELLRQIVDYYLRQPIEKS